MFRGEIGERGKGVGVREGDESDGATVKVVGKVGRIVVVGVEIGVVAGE